jgi:hypothetical protein
MGTTPERAPTGASDAAGYETAGGRRNQALEPTMGSAHNVELGSMDKRSARRLKPGAVVLYNEGSSRGLPTWWGRLRRVSENGGCLIEPFSRHWRESAPEPDVREALMTEDWAEPGLPERWIPLPVERQLSK